PNTTHARRRRNATVVALSTIAVLALVGCTATPDAGHLAPSLSATAAASPAVASVSPAVASVVQQQTVTITGTALGKVKTVRFGSQPGVITGKRTADQITVTAPAAVNYQAATVPIKLIGTNGKTIATKAAAYAYTANSGVAKQTQYALTYWQNYNTTEYGDLNAASLGLQEFSFDQRSQIAVGDIAIFTWAGDSSPDHVQVVTKVTKVNGTIKIEMASHNDDYNFRDLDDEITVEHPGATGHFWHLTR
ncbi:MAG: amidase domain-containing protein, partial [Microbacteriaceae bacterium]